ncbi:Endonuclease/exonuclease/phosphatase [Ephemerocybe angulata]|uniref:Endonuclease/exonuclease/phosphatase n=1 Tax=Ephemerocybe angulata TaxID=980116 RepID=A0A8H6H954_9AGAR|nr:Endonuclease/exonuclease/phosphatase [Tulosesus angulatus]
MGENTTNSRAPIRVPDTLRHDPDPGQSNRSAVGPTPNRARKRDCPWRGLEKELEEIARGKKRLKANIHIASLNIRGGAVVDTNQNSKWNHINQIMRDNKLGILVVQETHLKQSTLDRLNARMKKNYVILNSSDDNRPNMNGVALVLSKRLTAWAETNRWTLEVGRALLIRIPWKNSRESRTILAIYAPNDPKGNTAFWQRLTKKWDERRPGKPPLPKPDIMLRDFNLVEDSADRLPARSDDEEAVEALDDFKCKFSLFDGWRLENPDEIVFMYRQLAEPFSHSRIDRIYVTKKIYMSSRDWYISPSGLSTDHWLVNFQYFDRGTTLRGRGRWVIPAYVVKDETFQKEARQIMQDTLEDMRHTPPGKGVRQKVYNTMKEDIHDLVMIRIKRMAPKLKARIWEREQNLSAIINDKSIPEKERAEAAAEIEEEIDSMRIRHHTSVRDKIHIKYHLKNERVGKTWMSISKDKETRDPIKALMKPAEEGGGLEYNSKNMAEIARKYHANLQLDGLQSEGANPEEVETHMDTVLNSIKKTLTTGQAERMGTPQQEARYGQRLKESPTTKLPASIASQSRCGRT